MFHSIMYLIFILREVKKTVADRGVPFPFPHQEVCDRCASLFQSLDLAGSACSSLRSGDIPPELRERLTLLLDDGVPSSS